MMRDLNMGITTFTGIAAGLVSFLLVVYVIGHDWHIKNKRVGWLIKLLFLGLFLGLLLGRAAMGFVIGLAAGAVIGLLAGIHIGLVTGQTLTAYSRRVGESASPGIVTRLATGGMVGATTGAVLGLVVGSVVGGGNNFGGSIAGGAVGFVVGAVIGRGVSVASDRVISTESNSLEGGGIGMPTGAAIGAMVGTVMGIRIVENSGLIGMVLTSYLR